MRSLTALRLKLDRRMVDMESLAQRQIDAFQNASAIGDRHLRNRHMAGQRMRTRSEAPDVKVVHIQHSLNRLHRVANLMQLQILWRPLEQDVQRLAHNSRRAVQNHPGDDHRQRRIDPRHPGKQDPGAAHDHRRGR